VVELSGRDEQRSERTEDAPSKKSTAGEYKKERIKGLIGESGGGMSRRTAKKLIKQEVKARKEETRAILEQQRRAKSERAAGQTESGGESPPEDRSAPKQVDWSPPEGREPHRSQMEDRREPRKPWSEDTREARDSSRSNDTFERADRIKDSREPRKAWRIDTKDVREYGRSNGTFERNNVFNGGREFRNTRLEDKMEVKDYDRANGRTVHSRFDGSRTEDRSSRYKEREDTESEDRRTRYGDRPIRENSNGVYRPESFEFKGQRDIGGPISIPYTTAASEFLYGHSVVVAALKAQRRKLYNLYLHPRSQRESGGSSALQELAKAAGVNVIEVGDDWLRVMDKMSTGRPHNVSDEARIHVLEEQSQLPSFQYMENTMFQA